MQQVVQHALNVAPRDVTILIEGESGTGKELFARAIHAGSLRAGKSHCRQHCGCPAELIVNRSYLAIKKERSPTLLKIPSATFNLPRGTYSLMNWVSFHPLRVKLLRALEERAVIPVGGTQEEKVNVRIIAATNKNLMHEGLLRTVSLDCYSLAVRVSPLLQERGVTWNYC